MAHLKLTQFAAYSLTQQEEISGSILINDQKLFIQNQLAFAAQQALALVPDPVNYTAFIQTDAHLKGQIAAYQYLLDCSDASELAALEEAQNRQE